MRYKLLGKSGVRVSELALGTMTFGEDWGWGADYPTSKAIFDRFVEAGGNFIDTANNYTNGTSERYVGEFIQAERDNFVVATKYTLRNQSRNTDNMNLGGNSRKSMMTSVEHSLKNMNTDYIDLLYLHMWDSTTPIDEVLRGVDDLVRQGKVLYFAFSDSPSWVVSAAVTKAESFGWTRPVAMQIPYSVYGRSIEREVLPMARHYDLAILPWGLLSGGLLTGKYSKKDSDEPRRQGEVSDAAIEKGDKFVALAKEFGYTPSQVAINWVRQQAGVVIPILGCRTLAQLEDNLGCLDFTLTDEQMAALNDLADFKAEFPVDFLTSPTVIDLVHGKEFYELLDNHHTK